MPHRRTTEAGRKILERVVRRIGEVSPPGLGHWSPAWEKVHAPGDDFLDALRAWEARDDPLTRAALQSAAEAFVGAWKDAAQEWQAEQRPGRRHEVAA